ncbi:hypothetical protein BC833DRAFT_596558 [Globomyces pollinis-pini]|nr:hypothetical protein BC833DRAFT_596558 [Globomyces pollinis-pini]
MRLFALNVGGYGVLGLFVAYKIWTEGSWFAYAIGVICIGIADLAFLLLMVYPGKVIEMKFEVLLGPIIWFLAILITPFGLFKDDGVKKRQ